MLFSAFSFILRSSMYRLDRSYAKAQSFEDADNQYDFWSKKSVGERLRASWYLTCQAYGLEYRTDHKLDRSIHSMRKHVVK